jgi:putative ABC transport system substrate-binding protein
MRLERTKFIALQWLLALAFLSGTVSSVQAADNHYRVLAIKTRDIEFYNTLMQSFRRSLQKRVENTGRKVDFTEIALTGNADQDARTVRDQVQKEPQLILTLGTNATRLAAGLPPKVPVLFSMILDPVSLGVAGTLDVPGGMFTGTTLLISPGKQLDTLLQAAPKVRKIGVFYSQNDSTSLAFLAQARQQAQSLHLEIAAVPVSSDKETDRGSIEAMAGRVDAFWLIPDPASTSPRVLADTLAVARVKKLPVLGDSSATVRAGALLSLSANLDDLGDVCAEMALPLLESTATPGQMRVRGPRRTTLSLNLITAKDLGLSIPDPVLHLADEVVDSDAAGK